MKVWVGIGMVWVCAVAQAQSLPATSGGVRSTGYAFDPQKLPALGSGRPLPEPGPHTVLLHLEQGGPFSKTISAIRLQGFDLSSGQYQTMAAFYSTQWTDLRATFLTQINPRFGVVWGISTGEQGKKYRIDPGMQLGFIYLQPLTERTDLRIRAHALLGGRLREKPCVGDFGAIGGVQLVNCRLAATPLSPDQTLQYLLNEKPRPSWSFRLTLTHRF